MHVLSIPRFLSTITYRDNKKLPMYNNQKMQDFDFSLPFISQFPNLLNLAADHPKSLKKTFPNGQDSQQESFQPDHHQLKRLGIKANKKKIIVGSWSGQENQTYLQFMLNNKNDFLTQKSRRTTKIFYRLSKILKRRTPDQCRSHHQKLQMKFKDDIDAIMLQVLRKVQKSIAQKFINTYHQLFNPNCLATLEMLKKTELCVRKQANKQKESNQQIQDFKWHKISIKASSVKIQIKTVFIKEWDRIDY